LTINLNMSHIALDMQWQDAMSDLMEIKMLEEEPAVINEETKKPQIENPWSEPEIFEHLGRLYVKYIQIYRKLEECYDQIVHPQKRQSIKQILESTMLRICEIKFQLVNHNPRSGSLYVHMDQLLFDLKYDPTVVEIPVPRYFKEVDDNIEVKIAFKEAVVRPGKKKKKGRRKKKGKKKKKKDAPPPDKMTLWK
jgi:IQ and AAA domain-containing protein